MNTDIQLEVTIEVSRMIREAEKAVTQKLASEQKGELFEEKNDGSQHSISVANGT
jgi:hypothetical protein